MANVFASYEGTGIPLPIQRGLKLISPESLKNVSVHTWIIALIYQDDKRMDVIGRLMKETLLVCNGRTKRWYERLQIRTTNFVRTNVSYDCYTF